MGIIINRLSSKKYDYFVNKYPPFKLTIASLDNLEKHYCSFLLAGVQRSIFGFKNDGSLYICHLTDIRLIIEPYKMSNAEILAMKHLPKILNIFFGDDSSPIIEQYIKGTVKANVKKMSFVKNMYNNDFFIIIPYSDIQIFDMVWAAIFNFKTKDGKELLFKANKLPRNFWQMFVSPKFSQDFVALGNDLLEAYRKKQLEIERQRKEIERKRKEIERQRKETLNHKKNQDTVILGGNRRFNELNKLIERVVESTVIFIHALGDNNVIILFAILIVLFLSYFNL